MVLTGNHTPSEGPIDKIGERLLRPFWLWKGFGVARFLDKVRIDAPPTEDVARYRQGATVTVRTTDGRTSASTVYAPKGAGLGGIAWADIDAKYHTLMPHSGLADRQVEASLAIIHDFRRVKNVSALTSLLQPKEA